MKYMKRQRSLAALKTCFKASFSVLLLAAFLLTVFTSHECDPMLFQREAESSGQFLKAGEKLAKSRWALLETGRQRNETVEGEKNRAGGSLSQRRMLGVTVRVFLAVLPAVFRQFWSAWNRTANEILPRSLLVVRFIRRSDGKKNGIFALIEL